MQSTSWDMLDWLKPKLESRLPGEISITSDMQMTPHLWQKVHGVVKTRTRLSDVTFIFHFHTLEKEMAAHSTVLAWRIPGMAEPGGLPSTALHRVGHDWSDLAVAAEESRMQHPWGFISEKVWLKDFNSVKSNVNILSVFWKITLAHQLGGHREREVWSCA